MLRSVPSDSTGHGSNVPESVTGSEAHRILDLRVVPDLNAGIVPPVEAVANVAAIVERNPLLQDGGMRLQHEFHRPLHSVDPVNISHQYESAAVVFLPERKIDGRQG